MSTIASLSTTVTMRLATPADDPGIARIAELDSAEVPAGPLLVAIVDGTPLAVLSLDSGEVVADPFSRTAELVALLHTRAAAISGAEGAHRATARMRLRSARARLAA